MNFTFHRSQLSFRKAPGIFRTLARALMCIAPMLMAQVANAAETVTYYYSDNQGTVLATANSAGALTSASDYRPYGAQTFGSPSDGPGYTGHVNDVDSSLVYMQARYYDPVVGRFLSTDPVKPAVEKLFGFSRYAYANNNPIDTMDPDGREAPCVLMTSHCGQFSAGQPDIQKAGGQLGEVISEADQNIVIPMMGAQPTIMEEVSVALEGVSAGLATFSGVSEVAPVLSAGGEVPEATGGLNLFKWGAETTTTSNGWRGGDYMLNLADKGSPAANWAQNAGRLREAMRGGQPIFDSYRDLKGLQIPTNGFLNAERNLLEVRGWVYDAPSGAYHPPLR
ncbi:RHS repeat domain-containing protein [Pinirhizobacter soli]|uniref:RHS repeat domain-containing protein n=1 Tax=Pinirhizobacter soli TaxID=2786953 RepID=UPI00202ABDFB|nr:RHS repeat-associated core domain-containing protein [Pinirhizobacter soli]